jgi:hypothetical protein
MRESTDPGLLGEELHVHDPGNGTESDGEGGHVHQQAANKNIINSNYKRTSRIVTYLKCK